MTEDEFHRYEKLVADAGFEVKWAGYDVDRYGSWIIQLTRRDLPQQTLLWDAKDRALTVEVSAFGGSFSKWFGSEHELDSALASLVAPVSQEWLSEMERQRSEGLAAASCKQALSTAAGLWEHGRYVDYVHTLSPHIERLSPAQLKRLDLAKRRAADG